MCSLSRYLLVGGLTALAISSLTGSDPLGWLAGLAAVAGWAVLERRHPERFGGSCAVPGATRPGRRRAAETHTGTTPYPTAPPDTVSLDR